MFGLEGATEVQKEVFWTGVVHALQVCKFRSLVCFFMLNRVSFTILQNNMSKDVTILDTTARFTKLKVENRILGILYG
jgi:hypothetical protein